MGLLRGELDARARAEAALRARIIDAESRLAARVLLDRRTHAVLGELRTELGTLRDALQQERARRQAAEHRAAELGSALASQRALSRGASDAIAELRVLLAQARSERAAAPAEASAPVEPAAPTEPAPPEPAPPGLAGPPGPSELAGPPEPPAPPGEPVQAERLADALSRLRQTIPAQDGEPDSTGATAPPPATGSADQPQRLPEETPQPVPADGPPQRTPQRVPAEGPPQPTPPDAPPQPTPPDGPPLHQRLGRRSLDGAFRRLVAADADAAGRLLLELLPLQAAAYPQRVSYDLVLGRDRACVCVTVAGEGPKIGVQGRPRPRGEVDFQVFGEPARIARLLTAGRFRRRFGRRVAKVRGRRERLEALSALLGMPLDLQELHCAGVRLGATTAFALVASMVDPAWTAGNRFTIAHEEREASTTYLLVRDGRPLEVTQDSPGSEVTTTIRGTGDRLLLALAGEREQGFVIRGETAPLTALRHWIKRAQSA